MAIPRPQREAIDSLLAKRKLLIAETTDKIETLLVIRKDGGFTRVRIGGVSKGDDTFHRFKNTEVTVLFADESESVSGEHRIDFREGIYVFEEDSANEGSYTRSVIALRVHHSYDQTLVFERIGEPVEFTPV